MVVPKCVRACLPMLKMLYFTDFRAFLVRSTSILFLQHIDCLLVALRVENGFCGTSFILCLGSSWQFYDAYILAPTRRNLVISRPICSLLFSRKRQESDTMNKHLATILKYFSHLVVSCGHTRVVYNVLFLHCLTHWINLATPTTPQSP